MFSRLRPKSEFTRNVLTLMTGTTIAQAIPIAISPILTRIYTPEEFGIFALYMSIAMILSVIATGRYELAIMLPEKDEDAINIVVLSIVIAFFISLVTLVIVFLFNTQISDLLGNHEIASWLYFVPLTIFLTGSYQSFNYWNNRRKQYRRLAISRVVQSGTTATANLSMGFGGTSSGGLIFGQILGQSLATVILGRLIFAQDRDIFSQINRTKIIILSKKYIDHPKYLTLSHGIASIYTQIPVFFISKFFGLQLVGFYMLANRFMTLPGSLIAKAIGDVYREQATRQYHKTGTFHTIFLKTLKHTFLIATLPFLLLYFTVDDLFVLVFSEEWKVAGAYAQILIISAYVSFVITPIDKSALIVNDIGYIFWWHIGRFGTYLLLSGTSYLMEYSIYTFLYGLVAVDIIFYIYDLYKEYNFSKGTKC